MKIYTILIVLLTVSAPLLADKAEEPVEITIYSGMSFSQVENTTSPCLFCEDVFIFPPFYREHTRLDNSVLVGFKGAYFLNRKIALEGNFSVAPSHELTSESTFQCPPGFVCPAIGLPFVFSQENTVAYHYDGSFVYHLTDGNVRPFFLAGLGGISAEARNELFTDFSLIFGAGVKFYFQDIGLRFEVNDHMTPNHWLSDDTEHYLQLQFGFLFRL